MNGKTHSGKPRHCCSGARFAYAGLWNSLATPGNSMQTVRKLRLARCAERLRDGHSGNLRRVVVVASTAPLEPSASMLNRQVWTWPAAETGR
jgi:hypothetical protein